MISLRTRPLAWGGRVWARAYIWVVPYWPDQWPSL